MSDSEWLSPHFSVTRPRAKRVPLVVEIPHAGLRIDALALASLIAPAQALGRDADLYVDELYAAAPSCGASLLLAHTSRYICDLNRDLHDVDPQTVAGGTAGPTPHGLVWRSTTDLRPALSAPLSVAELERRVDAIYRPYHAALQQLLEETRREFGYVILLCGHSMPSVGRNAGSAGPTRRADVVPGSRGGTSAAPAVIVAPERLAQQRSWSVSHDVPYRGGFTTGYYGRPREGVHALQVELARRLYMDEVTLRKNDGFSQTQAFCTELMTELGQLKLA